MKIWQAMDDNVYTYHEIKPSLKLSMKNGNYANGENISTIKFPIQLKRLQIAEITINEDGTWTYEIEREDGLYIIKYEDGSIDIVQSYNNFWIYPNSLKVYNGEIRHYRVHMSKFTISKKRIPDECLI